MADRCGGDVWRGRGAQEAAGARSGRLAALGMELGRRGEAEKRGPRRPAAPESFGNEGARLWGRVACRLAGRLKGEDRACESSSRARRTDDRQEKSHRTHTHATGPPCGFPVDGSRPGARSAHGAPDRAATLSLVAGPRTASRRLLVSCDSGQPYADSARPGRIADTSWQRCCRCPSLTILPAGPKRRRADGHAERHRMRWVPMAPVMFFLQNRREERVAKMAPFRPQ